MHDLLVDDVRLLRWPDEETQRQRLAAAGRPRLLLLAEDAPAPRCADELEDWIREPFTPGDFELRRATLERRARRLASTPTLDRDGSLSVTGRHIAIAIAEVQRPMMAVLVERFGRAVPNEDLARSYASAGGSAHASAIKAVVRRLNPRLATLGLALHNIRGRGFLLDVLEHPSALVD